MIYMYLTAFPAKTWREFMADFQEYRLRLLKKEVVKVHLNW